MRDIHRHVDPEALEKYSMGVTTPEEVEAIEKHLLTCVECQERLRDADGYLVGMRLASQQLRREEQAAPQIESRREWSLPAWFPVLAAVACCLLLVVFTLHVMRPTGTLVAVSLTAMRSDGAGSTAPAGRILALHPDLTGLTESSTYRLEIVDQTGRRLRQSSFARAQDGVQVPALGRGLYFVRVYLPAGDLLREYGLQIQ